MENSLETVCLNANVAILKKINVSVIVHFWLVNTTSVGIYFENILYIFFSIKVYFFSIFSYEEYKNNKNKWNKKVKEFWFSRSNPN